MAHTAFRAPTASGDLVGWTAGDGPPVLALHGGPGLSFTYLDAAVEEIAAEFRVATFQQRGLAPSTTSGPFTIDQAVADVAAVLDHLGWDQAYVVGHSWGGHLAFHVARDLAPRLLGVLSVDPLGGVGDGGSEAFGAELLARTPAIRFGPERRSWTRRTPPGRPPKKRRSRHSAWSGPPTSRTRPPHRRCLRWPRTVRRPEVCGPTSPPGSRQLETSPHGHRYTRAGPGRRS